MNGNGNDFLVFDNMSRQFDGAALSEYALLLCRRRESLGADGLLVVEPSEKYDFKMRLFNRDGSEGEMCGNGARCIARFAYEKNIVRKNVTDFETLGGPVHASVNGERVTIDMAPVRVKDCAVNVPASVEGFDFKYTFLTVGVPHVVIFEDKHSREFEEYVPVGRLIRNRLDLFPDGANVNFAAADPKRRGVIDVFTYERGVEDMTLSCGTGSTASAIAALLTGIADDKVDVYNPGGVNRVSLEYNEDKEYILPKLEGSALFVAEITVLRDALK